jgi:hypothetical protein
MLRIFLAFDNPAFSRGAALYTFENPRVGLLYTFERACLLLPS